MEVLLCGPPTGRGSIPVDSVSNGEASNPFSSLVQSVGVTWTPIFPLISMSHPFVRSCFFRVKSLSKVRSYLTARLQTTLLSH